MSYRIHLEKENFKFSCSHFTIFGPGNAERLHGHNYYVSVELRLAKLNEALGLAFDFNEIKPLIRQTTAELDEYVLLPQNSRYLQIEESSHSIRAIFANKRYELPREDVRLLPLSNISSEELAKFIASELVRQMKSQSSCAEVSSITVGVQETRGQSVFYEVSLN
jgi:6-pyruvoyltetrahydropterin/6-carboxytetrahydropterin synthase